MPNTIYYVGAKLSPESAFLLWCYTGTALRNLHTTIIYSRKWFPYKEARFFPLTIEPPYLKYEMLLDQLVMTFENTRLFERYIELRNLGATTDFDHFKAHITLGNRMPKGFADPPGNKHLPDFPLTFSNEYYRTWVER